jgi:hypothetical protein
MSLEAFATSSINTNALFHRHIWNNSGVLFSEVPLSLQHRAYAKCVIASSQAVHLKLLRVLQIKHLYEYI